MIVLMIMTIVMKLMKVLMIINEEMVMKWW